ncbi:MAG: ATP-binding protein [Candidatus Zixiibacteriota bacterium]
MPVSSEVSERLVAPADLTADAMAAFDHRLFKVLAEHPDVVILECAGLDRVTSDHISLLWRARRSCELAGIPMRLESPRPGLVRVLQVLDLGDFFDSDTGEQTALASTGPAAAPCDHSFSHVFTASILGFNSAVAHFNVFLQQLSVPETLMSELQTLFYEAGFNIVRHAGLDRGSRITVSCEATYDRLRLRFVDFGRPFNPTEYPTVPDVVSAASQRRTGGLGILMLRRLSDHLSYTRTGDGRNVLEIEKRISR